MEPSDLNEIEDLNLRFRSKFTGWWAGRSL